jgi:orotate phosphoribosyltransferase
LTEAAPASEVSQRLLALLPTRRGHFVFESGFHGEWWLDLDALFARPSALRPIVDELARRLAAHHFDAVCGPVIGGALLAQMIAESLSSEFYFTERIVTGDEPSVLYQLAASTRSNLRGKTVAVVDDAVNAGSAVRGTLDALRAAGATPIVLGSLVLMGSATEHFLAAQKMPMEYIARLPAHLWPPPECPLCAAGVPLEVS